MSTEHVSTLNTVTTRTSGIYTLIKGNKKGKAIPVTGHEGPQGCGSHIF
jgi:hypothetical protein